MPNPVCPSGCAAGTLPEVLFDLCSPEFRESEIVRVFVGLRNTPAFTDVAAAAEWTDRLSMDSTDADAIRPLTVIGDKPAPTKNEKEYSAGRTVTLNKSHVLNITVDEVNAKNHEFVRQLECSGQARIWYETKGGLIFGGNEGIPAKITLDMVLPRGDENMRYEGTVEWKARFTEERAVSPIALTY